MWRCTASYKRTLKTDALNRYNKETHVQLIALYEVGNAQFTSVESTQRAGKRSIVFMPTANAIMDKQPELSSSLADRTPDLNEPWRMCNLLLKFTWACK